MPFLRRETTVLFPILHVGESLACGAVRFSPQPGRRAVWLCIMPGMVVDSELHALADEALMLAYAGGEAAAFECLYDRHSMRLWRYLFRNTGNHALADDLGQEVWFAVVDAAPAYEVKARFTTWLFTVAHHKLVDHWRGHKPQLSLNEDTPEAMSLAETLFAHSGFEPEKLQGRKDLARALLDALADLPQDQRTAFLLQAEGDMSVADIAAATGVPQETAKTRLRYARAKLRQALEVLA